jgi:hypothetical protein
MVDSEQGLRCGEGGADDRCKAVGREGLVVQFQRRQGRNPSVKTLCGGDCSIGLIQRLVKGVELPPVVANPHYLLDISQNMMVVMQFS